LFTPFQLAKKYIYYYLTAANGKGHGTHSPFVFNFITKVLQNNQSYPCYKTIEQQRQLMLQNDTVITIEDFGAGSTATKSNQRVVKQIAATSLKSKKYARLLFRMVQYYQPTSIIELGTSLGITTAYLANGNPAARVYSCEGATAIAALAQQNFNQLDLKNIQLITGNFTSTLPALLQQINTVQLAFIDGNHRQQPTLDYFTQLLPATNRNSILIFDDIHWSAEMEAAWAQIKDHPAVTLSIDLFFIGIVFFNSDFKAKQHFVIRF
jgi:predicted O-methyltransferase YrrM